MDAPSPAPWTFAARAAYFGDQVCAFCERHNPAGAKFCNDCGSPLDLKPCKACAAVNQRGATSCHNCGVERPALTTILETPLLLPAAERAPATATAGDMGVPAIVAPSPIAAGVLRARSGLSKPRYLAAIVTLLVVGTYAAYRIGAVAPDAREVTFESIAADKNTMPAGGSAAAVAAEPRRLAAEPERGAAGSDRFAAEPVRRAAGSDGFAAEPEHFASEPQLRAAEPERLASQSVEPDTTATFQRPIPATRLKAPKRDSARQRSAAGSTIKRASTPQRSARIAATPRAARTIAVAHVHARAAQTRKARRPDAGQLMSVSLAQCGSDLITRIVCDQRARRRLCEGRWGSPECASGITNDRGQ